MKIDLVENCEVEKKIKLDFKEDYKKWFKALCAFANTSGGVMNVGISDGLDEVGFKLHEMAKIDTR